MQLIYFVYMTIMFILIAFWIGKLGRKIDALSKQSYQKEEEPEDHRPRCPSCDAVESIFLCSDVVDGVNHTGLDSFKCTQCGHMLVTTSTLDAIEDIKSCNSWTQSIVMTCVKDIVFNCHRPNFEIFQAFNKLNRNSDILKEYTSDVATKALLRDESSLYHRVQAEVEAQVKSGFPECFAKTSGISILKEEA